MSLVFNLLERDLFPDSAIRFGIRRLLAARLRELEAAGPPEQERFIAELGESPIAIHTRAANEQHYELPANFFKVVLGRHLKYSSAYWPAGVETLDAAELAMLELSAEHAGLAAGQEILELGCGWGSLTLFMAERYPNSRILAVSNSSPQRHFIQERATRRGLENIEVVTVDMNDFTTERRFDRVVSIEMFEHMRNYRQLLARIASWLVPQGRLFVHVFCHKRYAYPFDILDASDWLAKYFFTGGIMPSADLLPQFDDDFALEERWLINGQHYGKTCEAWLAEMDVRRADVLPILEQVYGHADRRRWWVYWRVFFMACAELFNYRGGEEWMVAHYRFARS